MKKIVIVLGLLCYSSGTNAMWSSFFGGPASPSKKQPLDALAKAKYEQEIQALVLGKKNFNDLVEALKKPENDGYYELPDLDAVEVLKADGTTEELFGNYLRNQTNAGIADIRAIYEKYMFRGGNFLNTLQEAHKTDADLERLAKIVQSCPSLMERVNLFGGPLGDHIEVLCGTGNQHARIIRAAYKNELWEKNKADQASWKQDEAILKGKANLKAKLAIFEKRSPDERLKPYIAQLKVELEKVIMPNIKPALAGDKRSTVDNLIMNLEKTAKIGIEFDVESIASLLSQLNARKAILDALYLEELTLKACFPGKPWVVTPEVANVLKKHKDDPRFKAYIDRIKAELSKQLTIVLTGKSRTKGVDRLETWLTALADAGIEFDGAEKVADFQARLKTKKDDLAKAKTTNQNDDKRPEPQAQSWLTPGKIIFGLACLAVGYALYTRLQNTDEHQEATRARA